MSEAGQSRKLAAILAADVAGYSPSHATTTRPPSTLSKRTAPSSAKGSKPITAVVDMAGDSVLAVFGAATEAMRAALEIQSELAQRNDTLPEGRRMRFRIGVNLGEFIESRDGTVYGDGVNIAARLESIGEPGGICISGTVYDQVKSRLKAVFEFLGEQQVKNIAEPVRAYRIRLDALAAGASATATASATPALALPDKPSIAVLPFDNMSGDPEQEFFADGVVEAITATLSRIRSFFVIARNSAFRYKGRAVDVSQVGRELGVRYVLEGSVQKAGGRVRITVQLIDVTSGAHVWADRVDGTLEDVFDLQDRITERVAGALQPSIRLAEIERAATQTAAGPGCVRLHHARHASGLGIGKRCECEGAWSFSIRRLRSIRNIRSRCRLPAGATPRARSTTGPTMSTRRAATR